MKNIYIYGDSIMKATLPDANMKYRFHISDYLNRFSALPVNIVNRSKFGAYVDKGLAIVESDIKKQVDCDVALIVYGGNDCNFDWAAIANNPNEKHLPKTVLDKFLSTMTDIVTKLRNRGVVPVMMTLPPVHAARYFECITRDGKCGENILSWLGDVEFIFRYQEMYSNAIAELAKKLKVLCIDMRSYLSTYSVAEIVSADGIHPSERGYELIFAKLYECFKKILQY